MFTNNFFNNPVVHGVVSALLFAIPLVIAAGGSWQNLTLGGILAGLYQILKNKSAGLTAGGSPR